MAMLSDRTGKVAATEVPDADSDTTVAGRAQVDERPSERRRHGEQAPATTEMFPATAETVPAGPRPRVSMIATSALIVGVVAALTVLTGVLAGPGIALGLIAAFLGIAGLPATSRRHVAGKGIALLGIVLGLGSVALASLALTGSLPWLNNDTNQVVSIRDWLQAQMPWMFPSA